MKQVILKGEIGGGDGGAGGGFADLVLLLNAYIVT